MFSKSDRIVSTEGMLGWDSVQARQVNTIMGTHEIKTREK